MGGLVSRLQPEHEAQTLFRLLETALLRGNPKERADFYQSAIQNKWMSPNEAREKEDMNPYEGGDEFHGAENIFGDGNRSETAGGAPACGAS